MASDKNGLESLPWPREDAEPDPSLSYTIEELQPPVADDIRIDLRLDEAGGVVADIVWSDDLSELQDGGWHLFVTSPVVTQDDKLTYRVNTSEFSVELSNSHPLSELSIQRYELEMISKKSEPVPLFR